MKKRSRAGDIYLADIYDSLSMCGPNTVNCMVMEKLIEAQKLDIVKTVVATAGKAVHMSGLLVTLATFVAA